MKRLLAFILLLSSPALAIEYGRFQQTGLSVAVVVSSQNVSGSPNQYNGRNCLTSLDASTLGGFTCTVEVDDSVTPIWQIDISSNTVVYGKTWPIAGAPGAISSYGPCTSRGNAMTVKSNCSAYKLNVQGTIEP